MNRTDKELGIRMGAMVRGARECRGFTQQQLAEAAGMKPSAISRIESGRSVPRVSTLHTIAQALGGWVEPPRFTDNPTEEDLKTGHYHDSKLHETPIA